MPAADLGAACTTQVDFGVSPATCCHVSALLAAAASRADARCDSGGVSSAVTHARSGEPAHERLRE
jgi:hypothetical protein